MANTYNSGAILTIRRPNGKIEEVVSHNHVTNGVMRQDAFAKAVAATKAAGRGDILSQRPNVVEYSLNDQRSFIVGALSDLTGQFPTAKKAALEASLTNDLAAFDAAHPEIIAAIRAKKATRIAAAANWTN